MPTIAATRARLVQRIHRRYPTYTQKLSVGSREFDFTRIADPNRVLDDVAAEADRLERLSGQRQNADVLHLPYWAELWDSAIGLAQFLVEHAGALGDHPRTLDLGCGMGLTGMTAAAIGHRVLLADLESPALLFARLNAVPFDPSVRTRQLNWQTADLGERFDLILGADILYERKQWPYLEAFFGRHVADGGRVLLGEPGRPAGDDFPKWIEERGWRLEMHLQTVLMRSAPIRLFSLHR